MMTSLSYSQKLSSDSIRCVPIHRLRNALIVNSKYNKCREEVSTCRDSIIILNKLVLSQDSMIKIKSDKIVLYEKNETDYKEKVKNNEAIAESYKQQYLKQKKLKIFGYSVGVLGILLGIFVF